MRAPKKLYLVISRKAKCIIDRHDFLISYKKALQRRNWRNGTNVQGVRDWRIETYVKGD